MEVRFLLKEKITIGTACPWSWSQLSITLVEYGEGEKTKKLYMLFYDSCLGIDLELLSTSLNK